MIKGLHKYLTWKTLGLNRISLCRHFCVCVWGGGVVAEEGFPGGSVVKNLPVNAGDTGDTGLIPESGRFPGGGHGNSLQYSCLESPKNRGACWAAVHRIANSQTRLSGLAHMLCVGGGDSSFPH